MSTGDVRRKGHDCRDENRVEGCLTVCLSAIETENGKSCLEEGERETDAGDKIKGDKP
ncbi:MAG: hypothetical protein SFV17_10200 [Candidatus Obscuribacter sp.]|nr:hypothetical protein [Candidatus Obscuribacter sp.]